MIYRRKLLALSGAISTGAVAGCLEDVRQETWDQENAVGLTIRNTTEEARYLEASVERVVEGSDPRIVFSGSATVAPDDRIDVANAVIHPGTYSISASTDSDRNRIERELTEPSNIAGILIRIEERGTVDLSVRKQY